MFDLIPPVCVCVCVCTRVSVGRAWCNTHAQFRISESCGMHGRNYHQLQAVRNFGNLYLEMPTLEMPILEMSTLETILETYTRTVVASSEGVVCGRRAVD